jgi:hypothetical protein
LARGDGPRFNVFVTNLSRPYWGRPETNLTSANYGCMATLSSICALRTIMIGGRVAY